MKDDFFLVAFFFKSLMKFFSEVDFNPGKIFLVS